jgi:uncharacterized membrane protein YfcA
LSEVTRYGLVCLVVLLSHFQSSITGFGATVLALPFLAMLLGLHVAVPVLVMLAWLLSILIVTEGRRHINWREFGKLVGLVVVGLPVGMWLSGNMPEAPLKAVLGAFTLIVGVRGVVRPVPVQPDRPGASWKVWFRTALAPLGGVMHGAFGAGGPLIVVYSTRALPDKSVFRVTMCMLWATLNTILLSRWAATSALTAHELKVAGLCLPFTLLAMVLGTRVHYRLNEVIFRRIVYAVLVIAAVSLLASVARG